MKKNQYDYPGSEQNLYAVAAIAWQNCSDHLTRFHNFNAQYTAVYIADAVATIAVAKALPNVDARQALLTDQRAELQAAAGETTNAWQDLYVYINRSFDKTRLASMRKLAGGEYYGAAANDNWKALDIMLTMASEFISKYIDDLTNGNMPAAFETTFNAKKTAYDAAFKKYNDLKTGIQKDTDAKIEANNAVYAQVVAMLQDAKAIFRKEIKIKKLFTYTALARLVGKKGKGGFRIAVKEAMTLEPVTTATVLFNPGNITAFVNAAGIAEVPLAQGTVYTAVITTPGYDMAELTNLQPEAGVMQRIDVQVKKVAAAA